MDPNATLARLRELTSEYRTAGWLDESEIQELTELTADLDEWITKGGFLPTAWKVTR